MIAKFLQLSESGKSALFSVKTSKLCFGGTLVYAPAEAAEGLAKDDCIDLPQGIKIIDMLDENGAPMVHSSGNPFKVFSF